MGLAHDGYDGDAARGSNGFLPEERKELWFVFWGDGGENVRDPGDAGEFEFAGGLGFEGSKVEGGVAVVGLDEGLDDVGDCEGVRSVVGHGDVIRDCGLLFAGFLLFILFLFVAALVGVVNFDDADIVVPDDLGTLGVAIVGSHDCFLWV